MIQTLEEYSKTCPGFLERCPGLLSFYLARAAKRGKNAHVRPTQFFMDLLESWIAGEEPYGLSARILDGTHLIIYQVGEAWYSEGTVLSEQFYCRIAKGKSKPLEALDVLARSLGCERIMMATALANDVALGAIYKNHGYTQQSTHYVKEL